MLKRYTYAWLFAYACIRHKVAAALCLDVCCRWRAKAATQPPHVRMSGMQPKCALVLDLRGMPCQALLQPSSSAPCRVRPSLPCTGMSHPPVLGCDIVARGRCHYALQGNVERLACERA